MKNDPIVTMGICARNAERTVGQAVESVLSQDFAKGSMEIVFVDDGSEDGTLSIIQKYASEADIECRIFGGARIGLGQARNLVVNNAKGDYIVWVDADMILEKGHVHKQVKFMQSNPKVGIAGATFSGLPEKELLADLQNLEVTAFNHINKGKEKLNTHDSVCGGSIYRVRAIRQISGFNTNMTGAGEDEELEWRIIRAGWSVCKGTEALFFERRKKTWKAVWNQFLWYGYGAHFLIHKNIRTVKVSQLLDGFLLCRAAYRLTGRKIAFLLPVQFYFKRLAWYFGFLKAHMRGYGHTQ